MQEEIICFTVGSNLVFITFVRKRSGGYKLFAYVYLENLNLRVGMEYVPFNTFRNPQKVILTAA